MGQDKKQLSKLLAFVKGLYEDFDNREFADGVNAIVLSRLAITTQDEIRKIKDVLELRADPSIDYTFVKDASARKQLVIDNLRMENVLLNLSMSERERYDSFCVSAFLQVENILNYYYCEKFGKDLEAILADIEEATQYDKFPFKRVPGKTYYYVSEIAIASKIQAFCNQFLPYSAERRDYTLSNLHKLRTIRNGLSHRAGESEANAEKASDQEKKAPNPTLSIFRDTLRRLVREVGERL